MNAFDNESQDGLSRVEEVLREKRATANPLELDRIKLRAMSQAGRSKRPKGVFMRSRLVALITCAAVGIGTPAAMACFSLGGASGSQGGSGGSAQYGSAPCSNNSIFIGIGCIPLFFNPLHFTWHYGYGLSWRWTGSQYVLSYGYGWIYS
jgi:hypothetical protein